MPICFVVPAFNEAENLPRLLADLEARPTLFPAGSRLIVVDDGSDGPNLRDRQGLSAGRFRSSSSSSARTRGREPRSAAGFSAALDGCDDDTLIVTLEADTTSDLDSLPAMLERRIGRSRARPRLGARRWPDGERQRPAKAAQLRSWASSSGVRSASTPAPSRPSSASTVLARSEQRSATSVTTSFANVASPAKRSSSSSSLISGLVSKKSRSTSTAAAGSVTAA